MRIKMIFCEPCSSSSPIANIYHREGKCLGRGAEVIMESLQIVYDAELIEEIKRYKDQQFEIYFRRKVS